MDTKDIIFRCFASGSSGNCYYLGTRRRGILIDAGISARTIHKNLQEMGLGFENLLGVLITHDHADHIRAVGTLGEKIHLPIYATQTIHQGIDRNYGVSVKLRTSRRYFTKEQPFELGVNKDNLFGQPDDEPVFKINTFPVSHDSSECVGYAIEVSGEHFVIITDCGEPNETMEKYIHSAQHLVIEANHDEQMLLNGPYPTYLKERILSPRGHQSNVTCSELLANNYTPELRHVFLCHLSEENNDPVLAYNTVKEGLESAGAELIDSLEDGEIVPQGKTYLRALDRLTPSPIYVFKC